MLQGHTLTPAKSCIPIFVSRNYFDQVSATALLLFEVYCAKCNDDSLFPPLRVYFKWPQDKGAELIRKLSIDAIDQDILESYTFLASSYCLLKYLETTASVRFPLNNCLKVEFSYGYGGRLVIDSKVRKTQREEWTSCLCWFFFNWGHYQLELQPLTTNLPHNPDGKRSRACGQCQNRFTKSKLVWNHQPLPDWCWEQDSQGESTSTIDRDYYHWDSSRPRSAFDYWWSILAWFSTKAFGHYVWPWPGMSLSKGALSAMEKDVLTH